MESQGLQLRQYVGTAALRQPPVHAVRFFAFSTATAAVPSSPGIGGGGGFCARASARVCCTSSIAAAKKEAVNGRASINQLLLLMPPFREVPVRRPARVKTNL